MSDLEISTQQTAVSVLDLSLRNRNALVRAGLTTVEQVSLLSDESLLSIHNFGVGALNELRSALASYEDLKAQGLLAGTSNLVGPVP